MMRKPSCLISCTQPGPEGGSTAGRGRMHGRKSVVDRCHSLLRLRRWQRPYLDDSSIQQYIEPTLDLHPQFFRRRIIFEMHRVVRIASEHGAQLRMPIRCHHRSQVRCLLKIGINLRATVAPGVLAHLRPQKEMPHRCLDDVKAIEHLIDILQADVLRSLSEQRSLFRRRRCSAAADGAAAGPWSADRGQQPQPRSP